MAELGTGTYEGTIVSQAFGSTKAKEGKAGTPFFKIFVDVDTRVTPQGEEPVPTTRASAQVWLTEAAFTKGGAANTLRHIGFEGSDPATLDPAHPKHESLAGSRVRLLNKGMSGNYVQWDILTPYAQKESDAEVAEKVSTLYAKYFKEAGSSKPNTKNKKQEKPAPKKEEPTPTSQDGFPF